MAVKTPTSDRKSGEAGTNVKQTTGIILLVVDDEIMNRKLIEAIMAAENHEIITAEDGIQALACVAETRPDLILLDIMMPGMNGLEVVRRLKGDAATADIPVIMVTAMADHESITQALDAGADECMSKPVNAAELVLRVRNRLNLHKLGTVR
jgi:DNA-binding response OmpR family regulator